MQEDESALQIAKMILVPPEQVDITSVLEHIRSSLGVITAEIVTLRPTLKSVVGIPTNFICETFTALAVTFTGMVAVCPPSTVVTMRVVSPTATPVTTPLDTVATAVSATLHSTALLVAFDGKDYSQGHCRQGCRLSSANCHKADNPQRSRKPDKVIT